MESEYETIRNVIRRIVHAIGCKSLTKRSVYMIEVNNVVQYE